METDTSGLLALKNKREREGKWFRKTERYKRKTTLKIFSFNSDTATPQRESRVITQVAKKAK